MASRSLGSLTLDLILKYGGFEQGMDKAARTADKRMKEIEARANKFGKFLGTAIAAGAGAASGALIALTKNAIDYADHLNDLNQRLGISAEALSGWAYAAKQTGTDIDALGKGLKILSKNMAEALDPKSQQAGLFKALGVEVKDAHGNLRALEDILPEIAGKFKDLDNATTEAALSQQLFGKSGVDLLEFLNQGEDGLEALRQKARDLGVELNSQTLSAADEFNDKLADLKTLGLAAGTQLAEKLLPAMLDLVDSLQRGIAPGGDFGKVIGWIGEQAEDAVHDFKTLKHDLDVFISILDGVRLQAEKAFAVLKNIATLDFSEAKRSMAGLLLAREQTIDALTSDRFKFANVESGSGTTEVASETKGDGRLESALSGFLSSGGRSSRKRTGKSDAEKEAEALQRAYEAMNERLKEQVALFGLTGEAASLRYELEFGALAKLDPLKKAELLQMAEKLDVMRDEAEVQKQLDEINKRREEAVASVLEDIQAERDMLGQTVEFQDTYNKLKWAGVDANSAFGQSIIEANHALHEEARLIGDQIELMDTFRNEASNALADVISGTKSLSDAFKEMFDNIAQRITQMIADRWIEQLFGQMGTTGTGQSSGSWGWVGQLFGAMFGGGRASGGGVNRGMFYEVNENGPELLTVGGRDYLMMGNQAGNVTPNSGGGGTRTVNQTFIVPGPMDRRTREQTARMSGKEAARGIARTGR